MLDRRPLHNRSLRLCCWITTLVVLFLVRCVLEFRCGWVGVYLLQHGYHSNPTIPKLQHMKPATQIPLQPNHTETPTHEACYTDTTPTQPYRNSNTWSLLHGYHSNPTIPKLQHMKPATQIPLQPNHTETPTHEACNTDTTPTQPHWNSNTHRTKYNTTNVVIQQHSRKLLMMDILTSETCWAHKKWNKIASDIKLVFLFSTITMMHGPINISKICKFIQFFFSIKFFSPSFVKQTCRVTVCILIYSQAKIFTLPGLCAA